MFVSRVGFEPVSLSELIPAILLHLTKYGNKGIAGYKRVSIELAERFY